jgi:cytosine/adenosine deaminase-related metal-dependent hydrolase
VTRVQPLHIQNALVWNGDGFEQRDLFTIDVVVEQRPANALTVDLSGYTVFPGLINAHDHLELNHYPRTKYRERYDNASEWSRDMNAHLNFSPFKELRAYPLEDCCFIGGLKNLLSGVTTVIHHNPPHNALFRKDFPVRVLRKYGWAHSLYLSSDEEIVASYKRTPLDVPWFIHLAEGTDEAATGEYQRLKALGCVGSNTVLVHGVGLTDQDIADAAPLVRGLVWCPTTNLYLLGKTANVFAWLKAGGKLALGSDSRLTAEGDLAQEELYVAGTSLIFGSNEQLAAQFVKLMESQFSHPQAILGIQQVSGLLSNGYADYVVMKRGNLRSQLALVVRGGEPQIGDPDVMAKFPHIETVRARLDDTEKRINVKLARQIARCTLHEPGLELLEVPSESSFSRLWNGVRKP